MNATLKPTTPTSDEEEPCVMTKFANSKIYKLRSDNLPDTCYIGSTTQTLEMRLSDHVRIAKHKNCASRQIIEAGDYHLDELEAFPCTSKLELRKREQFHMNNNVCCNKRRAFQTKEERKEQIRVRLATKVQCFCGGTYTMHNKARHYKTNKHQVAVEIISMI